jgi:hypothetical protein
MSHFEQCVDIKFMCKLGKSASEVLLNLQQVCSHAAQKKFGTLHLVFTVSEGTGDVGGCPAQPEASNIQKQMMTESD